MNDRTQSLYKSLVGGSIDFSFKKAVASVTPIEQNIRAAKRRIERDVETALSAGGELAIMLLAELTSYYSKEIYYMAVRGCIEMRRYRPLVIDYMKLSVEEREKRLMGALSKPIRSDKNRDLKIAALYYFLSTYQSRVTGFKKLLTKEEYLIVA